jgi:hypothetical protein
VAPRYEHLKAIEETIITLNLARIAGFIINEVASKRSVGECMDRVIARCSKGRPHEDWARLGALSYDKLNPMRRWITTPFRVEPSPVKLAGLWFGIFNPYYHDKLVADIYVCGATRFEANDREWAVRPKWWPDDRTLLRHRQQPNSADSQALPRLCEKLPRRAR